VLSELARVDKIEPESRPLRLQQQI